MTDDAAGAWAIVLAGGEGMRLRSVTRAIVGDDRPKQYVPLIGADSLLRQAMAIMGEEWQHRGGDVPSTARRFLWDRIVDNLMSKIEVLAVRQGMSVTEPPASAHVRRPRAVSATSAANGMLVAAS